MNEQQNNDINELATEHLSIHSLNAFIALNAPPRGVMMAGHFSQRPSLVESEPNINLTGVEEEFGKYTFGIRMPEDGTVALMLQKYEETLSDDSINFNPETTVIYQSHETGEFDYFKIPCYASYHPTFGFQYVAKPAYHELAVNREFPKDTVFADTPAIHGDSHYMYGRNLNVITMSSPNVGLDGYVISRDALPKFNFRMYENRSISFGANEFPLNLYGTEDDYKPFPEIGEYVREDGLLAVLRRLDTPIAPSLLSKNDCRTVDYLFDNKMYVPAGQGRIVDMTVIKSNNINLQLPPEMTHRLEKYNRALMRYYNSIVKFEEQKIMENRRQGGPGVISVTPKLQQLIVEAKAVVGYRCREARQPITLSYRKEVLDGWMVNFTIEYEMTPNRGFKFTCLNGGKGVLCRIEEPENMPVDDDGNRADIITGPDSIPGRMNLGRLAGPYFAGAARDVRKQIMEEFGLGRNFDGRLTLEEVKAIPRPQFDKGVSTLLLYYSLTSEFSYREYTEVLTEEEQYQWIMDIINDKIYNFFPIETQKRFDEMQQDIEKHFKLTYGPVTYVGRSGKKVRTKNKFRIAPMYTMLLDKIADAWLSVDMGKLSNFGILAPTNRADKYTSPWRCTPPKLEGETEGRLYAGIGSQEMIAETFDRYGNIATQRAIAYNILHAEDPADIPVLVDREKIPLGSSRGIQIAQHQFRCSGFEVIYKPEKKD